MILLSPSRSVAEYADWRLDECIDRRLRNNSVDIGFVEIFARKTRRKPPRMSGGGWNIGGVNKGQPRAIINTCLPTSAWEGRWEERQGLLLEAEVLINEEFTGTFAIVRANYTPAARPTRSPWWEHLSIREKVNPFCANRTVSRHPRYPRGVRSKIEHLFSLIKKPRLPRIAGNRVNSEKSGKIQSWRGAVTTKAIE